MYKKICVSKKSTVVVLIFILVLTLLILSSSLLKTKTSLNSKAAPAKNISQIVGGSVVKQGQWPFMVRLFNSSWESSDPLKSGFCGGTLITPQWVLTAGHCVGLIHQDFDTKIFNTKALIGAYNLRNYNAEDNIFEIEATYRPPFYCAWWVEDYDIGLIKLKRPVSSTISKPIQLQFDENSASLYEGQKAIVLGWGGMRYRGPDQTILRSAVLPILATDRVREWVRDERKAKDHEEIYHYSNSVIYAGYPRGKVDSCTGDSGGPLLIWNGVNWIQAGIISGGAGCAQPYLPGIYTKISYSGIQELGRDKGKLIDIQEWILSIIGSLPGENNDFFKGENYTNIDYKIYNNKICDSHEWDNDLPEICKYKNARVN